MQAFLTTGCQKRRKVADVSLQACTAVSEGRLLRCNQLSMSLGSLFRIMQAAAGATAPEAEETSVEEVKVSSGTLPSHMTARGLMIMPADSCLDLQAQLLDSLFGTERGLTASSEVRAEISELISQLEAKNPTPSPNVVRKNILSVPISAEPLQLKSSADCWHGQKA